MSPSIYKKDSQGSHLLRDYYIDGHKFFTIFIELAETSAKESIKKFLESKDWIWYEQYFEVRYKSHTHSSDGLRVDIVTKPMNSRELTKARKL
ncbi:MAG: hypothetical protein DRQ40_00470 [Gammaproteobacteria bacterium]|nr:MAG: hypothetical protein DRQ40_00470 [Gammaproteobacteria bacterium]